MKDFSISDYRFISQVTNRSNRKNKPTFSLSGEVLVKSVNMKKGPRMFNTVDRLILIQLIIVWSPE